MKILFLISFFFSVFSHAQKMDSLAQKDYAIQFKLQKLIIPSSLITFGVVGLESHSLKNLNGEIHEEVNEHIDKRFTVDDFSQYVPYASVFVLDFAGIPAKHSLEERLTVAGTSYLIMATSVTTLKKISRVERPDGSSNNSFPSGHTATAFAGAEMVWQEYKDVSPWYGIGAYTIAAGTGFFRMYNDRHWLTDVVAGAGFGMLSTKIAYWSLPLTKKLLFKNKDKYTGSIAPFYQENGGGLAMVIRF